MEIDQNKKAVLVLAVAAILVAAAIFLIFKITQHRQVQKNVSPKEAQTQDQNVQIPLPGSAEAVSQVDEQISNEILGTVTEVYETDDPNFLLLTVEADLVEEKELDASSQQPENSEEDIEVPTTQKTFTVAVGKNTPIVGGTFDDLSEDDSVRITVAENIYKASEDDQLTAIDVENIEEIDVEEEDAEENIETEQQ